MTRDRDSQRAEASASDEIVAGVRAIRRQLGAAVGFDLDRLFDQFKVVEAEERAHGRTFVPPFARSAGASA